MDFEDPALELGHSVKYVEDGNRCYMAAVFTQKRVSLLLDIEITLEQ